MSLIRKNLSEVGVEVGLRPSAQEQRIQREERRKIVRLRMAIWQELDARGITTPDDIGTALGMPAAEVHKLLTRKRREGDVAALEAVAARLGVHTPAPWRRPRHYAVD
jgi:uncharacterized Fe-S cluster-containing radical SAM superfamily protein